MRATGTNKIETALRDWSEEDFRDAVEFANHPANGCTAVALYLSMRGIKASLNTVHRWQKSLIEESGKITRLRELMGEFVGLSPIEILNFTAAAMTDVLVSLKDEISEDKKMDLKKIVALTSLAKEARASAAALMNFQSTISMKELELGHALNFADKLETTFEGDEVTLERIKTACRGILTEIEGQYQQ